VLKSSVFRTAGRILVISVSLLFAAVSVHAQIVAGSITALNGSSTITRSAKKFAATYSAPVDVADELDTSPTGRLTVTLTDNSQFELSESSSLIISENLLNPNGTRASTSMTLLAGLARSLVRVTAGTPPNYEVHTPNAVASARGTTFDTYFINNVSRPGFGGCRTFTDVAVLDGTVAVRSIVNPTSPVVLLHSGQKTTVPCGLPPLPPQLLSSTFTGAAAGTSTLGLAGVDPLALAAASFGSVAIVSGGIFGGLAASGSFSSSSSPTPTPTPAVKKPPTPMM
jgi:hypothetical protein